LLGGSLGRLEKYDRAQQACERSLAISQQNYQQAPNEHSLDHLARSTMNLGVLLSATGKDAEAERYMQAAAAEYLHLVEQFPGTPGYRQDLATVLRAQANLARDGGRDGEALDRLLEAVEQLMVLGYKHALVKNAGGQWTAAKKEVDQLIHKAEGTPQEIEV